MRKIVFNGKYRSQARTGVQRVAQELVGAVGALKVEGAEALAGIDLRIATPAKSDPEHAPGVLDTAPGKLSGIPWEQLELPKTAGADLLVNLCNVGPISRRGDIVMIHDAQAFISPASYSQAFGLYYRTVLPILAKRASAVLTVSEYSRQCLAEARVAAYDDIIVLTNGVDHVLGATPDPSILDKFDLRTRPFIVAPASVQSHKNIGVLLEAAMGFTDPDLMLVLYGGASIEDFTEAGFELPQNVMLVGRVTDGQMRSLIEGARAFAFPSLTEGFGLPPLESMILGTPAIVAACGALPELCGNDVLYAKETEPEAWADAINQMAEDEAKHKALSISGRARAGAYRWKKNRRGLCWSSSHSCLAKHRPALAERRLAPFHP